MRGSKWHVPSVCLMVISLAVTSFPTVLRFVVRETRKVDSKHMNVQKAKKSQGFLSKEDEWKSCSGRKRDSACPDEDDRGACGAAAEQGRACGAAVRPVSRG